MFEFLLVIVSWYALGYVSAMVTAWALNGMVIRSDWLTAGVVALWGPCQLWLFLYHTRDVD